MASGTVLVVVETTTSIRSSLLIDWMTKRREKSHAHATRSQSKLDKISAKFFQHQLNPFVDTIILILMLASN
jgi:hypothetical protein